MIKYFKELEKPNDFYLDLVEYVNQNQDIHLNGIPKDFINRNAKLFSKINDYNLLYELKNEKNLYFEDTSDYEQEYLDFNTIYSYYINYSDLDGTGLSKKGIEKMNYLKQEYKDRYTGNCFIEDYEKYFFATYNYLFYCDKKILSIDDLYSYLTSAMTMAMYQNKISKEDKSLFDIALSKIKNHKIIMPKKEKKEIRMYLPNSWYITPYNHLYNCMGPAGHKEANLIYPYERIIRHESVANPKFYLIAIKKILEQGYITYSDYSHYTNLIYKYSSILPEEYYKFDAYQKSMYLYFEKRSYNPKIVSLITGIISAHAGLYAFFYNLKNNSIDYEADIEFVNRYSLDDILVRCCRFHKISSVCDKTITTSCINFEKEFDEYIKKGWKIDFVKPIILNPYTKRVEEYSDDFLKIRKILKK